MKTVKSMQGESSLSFNATSYYEASGSAKYFELENYVLDTSQA